MYGYNHVAVVYEWWRSGYPFAADESELFATEADAIDYRASRSGEGAVYPRKVLAPAPNHPQARP